ncbi:hypothetical protein HK099_004931 [Clydaea vesicula]|uniref:Uncharacterized protein n=1 Tax=Clydaea vesicula TaxID=447962 RepID=A0AAD5U139_9FUNG|nr:hypothetical protein HK099_004931 [Clydaea vesicula]KAJ3384197.1 hypothetical protein HDU92_003722 [Lobulomyces angularis]
MAIYTLTRVPVAVYPILGLMVFSSGFATWYVSRLARGPDVVWNRKGNPEPWMDVKQTETTKFFNPNGRFESHWSRKQF